MSCPSCDRLYPEVVGAPTQVCPHCGHETTSAAAAGPVERALAPPDPVGALQQAWRIARREYHWFLLMLIPALVVEIAIGFAADAYAAASGLPLDPARMTTGQQMRFLGVALPFYLVLYSVRLATWTFVAARALDVALGGQRIARWRAFVAPALALGFVLTLTYAAGLLLALVGFLVFLHWFLYAPAHLASGAPGVAASLEASRRFARERQTVGFTALVVLLGSVVAIPYFVLAQLPGTLGLVVPAVVAWLFGPIVPLLAASYVAVASGGPERRQADVVRGARSTTTCPHCGALIAYSPTSGSAVVVCPSCGHSGRVL